MARDSQLTLSISGNQVADKQSLQVIAVVCLPERNRDHLRDENEPELPAGYHHIRSAIGALLTVEPWYNSASVPVIKPE
jgi:hypothetical protein